VQGESKFNNTKHRRKTKNGKQKPKDKSAHYQPSNKVTNRHYSFGPAKISTFPGSDIRYQISDIRYHLHFRKRTGRQFIQAVPLFRGTPTV
jgi:hypothetical protein